MDGKGPIANGQVHDQEKETIQQDLKQIQTQQSLEMFEAAKAACNTKNAKRAVKKYYRRQTKEITGFESVIQGKDSHITTAEEERKVTLGIACSAITLFINVVFTVIKGYSAFSSTSSAVMASLLDNAMDVVSNTILLIVNLKIRKYEPHRYPHGKSRMEPIGVMLFAIVMLMTAMSMIMHSMEQIIGQATGNKKIIVNIKTFDLALFLATAGVKFICFLVMIWWKTPSVRAIAIDHFNDTWVNLVAFAMAFIGYRYWAYADPLGALIIALMITFNWVRTLAYFIPSLMGIAPKNKWYRQLFWILIHHCDDLAKPAYLRASSSGESYFLEVGLVINEGVTMTQAAHLFARLKKELESREDICIATITITDPKLIERPVDEGKGDVVIMTPSEVGCYDNSGISIDL